MRSFTGQYQNVVDSVVFACQKDTHQSEAPLPRFSDVECPFWHIATSNLLIANAILDSSKASTGLVFLNSLINTSFALSPDGRLVPEGEQCEARDKQKEDNKCIN